MTRGQLHHIEIYVSNLQKSSEFWGWFLEELGYELFQQWDGGCSYKLESTYLVFVQTEEKHMDVPYHRSRTGLNHLAFHGESREDIDQLLEKLKARNAPILYSDRHPNPSGPYAIFFEDPDCILVEVFAPN